MRNAAFIAAFFFLSATNNPFTAGYSVFWLINIALLVLINLNTR